MGKECCSNVSSRLWGGALRDETKNGCEGDWKAGRGASKFNIYSKHKCRNNIRRELLVLSSAYC